MRRIRVIPSLLIDNLKLVKTKQFKNPIYIGDPINAVKIFNEKEVDELVLLDITATNQKQPPNFQLISQIITEAFMPIGYGGGISNMNDIESLFRLGVEKVIMNAATISNPNLVKEAAKRYGNQSIVASIDVKKNFWGLRSVCIDRASKNTKFQPSDFAKQLEDNGVGEIILTSVDNEGMMTGYDLELIQKVTSEVSIPVVVNGGAGKIEHFVQAVECGAAAVSAGSMFVFHGKLRGILINYPKQEELHQIFKK
jgi:imidazole glycerol-phosphate synthase subunit HisF